MAEAEVVKTADEEFDDAFGLAVAEAVSGSFEKDASPVDKDAEKIDDKAAPAKDDQEGKEGASKDEAGVPGEGKEPGKDDTSGDQASVGGAEAGAAEVKPTEPAKQPEPAPGVTSEDFAKLNAKLDKVLPKEKEPEDTGKPAQEAQPFEYSEDEKKALADYEKEWDEHARVMSIREKRLVHDIEQRMVSVVDVLLNEINKGLAPILQNHVLSSQERHFAEVSKAHPDYTTHKDGVKQWIDSQPKYLQDAMRKVYEEGDTQGTIDLLTRYKKETGKVSQPAQGGGSKSAAVKDVVSEEKVAATAPVQARRTVVQTQGVDPNDFDAAWKEAVGS